MTSQFANEARSQPARYIHGPAHGCNLFQTRNSAWGGGVEPVFLNISEPPSPAGRNCVIMPDFFYDSNQGHCLCERAARLCAAAAAAGEQPGLRYALSRNMSPLPPRWMQAAAPCHRVNSRPLLSAIHANMKKQTRQRRAGHLLAEGPQNRSRLQ